MRKKIVLIILFLVFVLTGCFITQTQRLNSQKQLLEPKQVLENYFKYNNEKNVLGVISSETELLYSNNTILSTIWSVCVDSKYIKINSIKEESDPYQKESYMKTGDGRVNGVKEENVRVYRVDLEMKYNKDVDGVGSAKYNWWYFLIRKDKNSPWLIDDYGEG